MKKILSIITIIIIAIVIYFLVYQPQNRVKNGDEITIDRQTQTTNWRIIENGTILVIIWVDEIFDWMTESIKRKKIGAVIQNTITPEQKYGKHYDPNKKQTISLSILENISADIQTNESIIINDTIFTITGLSGDNAIIDSNPSHTRQDVIIKMTIKEKIN